jgi:hypothetical protein
MYWNRSKLYFINYCFWENFPYYSFYKLIEFRTLLYYSDEFSFSSEFISHHKYIVSFSSLIIVFSTFIPIFVSTFLEYIYEYF